MIAIKQHGEMMSVNNPKPIIFCCRSSIYASILLRSLLVNDQIAVSAVVVSTRFKRPNSNLFSDSASLIRQSGLRYFFYLAMITEVHALFGWLFGLPSVKQFAKRRSLPVHYTDNINSPESFAFIQASMPSGAKSLLLTAMFNQKISAKILQLSDLTCVNFHPGLLPDFRGVDPVLAAMQQRQSHCHVFLHQTNEAFDEGATIVSAQIALQTQRSLFWHQYCLFEVGAEIVSEWLERVWVKDIPIEAQPQRGRARYYTWPSKLEVSSIKRLLDWRDVRSLLFKRRE